MLFNKKPKIKHLYLFSTKVFAYISVKACKLGTKLLYCAELSIFVGYSKSTKTSCVYISAQHIIIKF
jgi:hypothetical protein